MSDVEGRCTCGAVRLEADLPTKFVAHCDCHDCSRAPGALFVTWAGFLDPQLRIAAGEDHLARYTTETSATRSFCRTCGTHAAPLPGPFTRVSLCHTRAFPPLTTNTRRGAHADGSCFAEGSSTRPNGLASAPLSTGV